MIDEVEGGKPRRLGGLPVEDHQTTLRRRSGRSRGRSPAARRRPASAPTSRKRSRACRRDGRLDGVAEAGLEVRQHRLEQTGSPVGRRRDSRLQGEIRQPAGAEQREIPEGPFREERWPARRLPARSRRALRSPRLGAATAGMPRIAPPARACTASQMFRLPARELRQTPPFAGS